MGYRQSHYASHPLVGTLGVPLVVYPGLKLNFLRPKFMREIEDFVRHPLTKSVGWER